MKNERLQAPEPSLTNNPEPATEPLILASGSRYRKQLLEGFTRNFSCISPDIDETALADEAPQALALRLAIAKARKVAETRTGATVIGSDQVASLNGQALGKPGNYDNAVKQLSLSAGNTIVFYTAICVISPRLPEPRQHVDITKVHFKALTNAEIESYVQADQPYDCAGSFRSEGLGASLIECLENSDPTALIGLPMNWLTSRLAELGYRGNG